MSLKIVETCILYVQTYQTRKELKQQKLFATERTCFSNLWCHFHRLVLTLTNFISNDQNSLQMKDGAISTKQAPTEAAFHRWDKVFKNEPRKICGRQPLINLKGYGVCFRQTTNFSWSILEYFVPDVLQNRKRPELLQVY